MAELDLSGKNIVVIDDESFSRQIVVGMLFSLGRPDIHQAKNGRDALALIKKLGPVDIVISDYKMPELNGLQLLKAVRTGEGGVARDLPFAMLTGYGQKQLVELALALDVNAFLVKRISKATLSDRLAALLAAAAEERNWLKPPEAYLDVVVDFGKSLRRRSGSTGPEGGPAENWTENCLNVLTKKFTNSDLKTAITKAADRMAERLGAVDAERIMAVFDILERHEKITVFDIAAVLATEDGGEPEIGGKLPNDIETLNGEVLFHAGVEISNYIAALVGQLHQIGVLKLSKSDKSALGLDEVAASTRSGQFRADELSAPDRSVRSVGAADVVPGDTLARDIFTTQGMLYASSGETMSRRSTALLEDLHKLDKIKSPIWLQK